MAFEKQQAFTVESKRNVKSDQFESTLRIEVQPEKPVKRVLSVNAMAKIASREKVSENYNFSGKTTYQVIYQTEDDSVCSVVAFAEWNGKLDNVKEDNAYIVASVMANTITGFSGTEIAISSLINVDAYGIVKEEIQTVENLPEDYVKLEKTYEYEKVVSFASDNFNEVNEEEISGNISEVLFFNGNVNVQNVVCGIDTVTVEGVVNTNGAYVLDGKVVPLQKTINFKREISALSTVPNHVADAFVNLENLMVTASVNETDQKTNLVFSVELSACVTVYSKEMATLVQDAFSVEKEIENTYECVTAENYERTDSYSENVAANIEVPENVQDILYVLRTDAEITDKTQTENGTILNGAIMVEAVLQGQEENAEVFKGFAPFSVLIPDAKVDADFNAIGTLAQYKLKQKELELEIMLNVTYKTTEKEYIGFVKSIEEKEEKQKSNAAIRVYVTREGEDLFAVAKAISMKPEEILNQNPGISNEIEGGTRLVVYCGLNLNF